MNKEIIKIYIDILKSRNSDRVIAMNDKGCSDYGYTVLTSKYNVTIEIMKELESLIK